MFTVLVYDVISDRRRNRFFKKLKAYLSPVQKSVFEGWTDPPLVHQVERLSEHELDLSTDSVRIYHLCRACAGLTVVLGRGEDVPDPDPQIIIF